MTKRELRSKYLSLRKDFPVESRKTAERIISEKIISSELFKSSGTILAYSSYGNEINVDYIIEEAFRMHKRVAYPLCDTKSETMKFYYINKMEDLSSDGAYGIKEPSILLGECVEFSDAICLVPAVAFDKNGYRIGHGKGYYDKFIPKYKGKTIGVIANDFLIDSIPYDDYDISVDFVVSEINFISVEKGR